MVRIICVLISAVIFMSVFGAAAYSAPLFKAVSLSYTRDVFVSSDEAFANAPEKLTMNSGYNTAMLEDKLLPDGVLYYDDVAYCFGPLGLNDSFNAVHAADKSPIVIDIPDGFYTDIRFIANNTGSYFSAAEITISYLDSYIPDISEISGISSYRALDSDAREEKNGERYIGKTGAVRNGGTYAGHLYGYYLKPNPAKIADKITIQCSNAVVYAVTVTGVDYSSLKSNIENSIKELPEVNGISMVYRKLVNGIRNAIDEAAACGIDESLINGINKFRSLEEKLNFLYENENEVEIHVAATGNDNDIGSIIKPLATFEGAKNAVRTIEKDKEIQVVFHEGEYFFDKGVKLNNIDSGAYGMPVVYRAAENANVVFKGSRILDYNAFRDITNQDILDRLKPEIASKVKELDLKAQGIDFIEPFVPYMNNEASGGEYISFYINGKEQPISQWPDGDGNYSVWDEIISAGSAESSLNTGIGGIIKYNSDNPSRWEKSDDFYFGGYPGYDYRYERLSVAGLDTAAKTMTMAHGSVHGFVNNDSKRWKVFNLLEEIDITGEWYTDLSAMTLYYYPDKSVTDPKFEAAVLKESFIEMEAVSDIIIKDIVFSQSCSNAITMRNDTVRVNIEGCTFSDIGAKAVYATGNIRGKADTSSKGIINGISDCKFTKNKFHYIGSSAIDITGGNRDTLTRGNNVISYNHIYNASRLAKNKPSIDIGGVGNTAENNIIHNIPFHAINFSGNDHLIQYNELYNAGREVFDAGVIYSGRSLIMRGSQVAYNYVHDYLRKDEKLGYDVVGVFLDDRMSGVSVHHNILKNGSAGVQIGGGQNNNVYNNTIINMRKNVMNTDNRGETWEQDGKTEEELQNALQITGYSEKYPELILTAGDPFPPHNNIIRGNLSDKPLSVNARMEELGIVDNNALISDLSCFVNPEKQDYRIVNGSDIHNEIPDILAESFDLNKIGFLNKKPDSEGSAFRLLYPENNADGINPLNCTFAWENALYADKYRLVIASDYNMQNILLEAETDFNYITVKNLNADCGDYYWRVYALNISRTMNNIWECTQPAAFNIKYPIVRSEALPCESVDISSHINSKMLIDEGKTDSGTGMYNSLALNQTLLNELLKKNDGKLLINGVNYYFSELNNGYKAINTGLSKNSYIVEINDGYYKSIRFLASAASICENYKVTIKYSDSSMEDTYISKIGRYDTTYNSGQNPVLELGLVNYTTGSLENRNAGYIYEYKIEPDRNKSVDKIIFSAEKNIQIYAVTAQRHELRMKNDNTAEVCFMLNNISDYEQLFTIITTTKDNTGKIVFLSAENDTLPSLKRDKLITVEMPAGKYITECFIWDLKTLTPLVKEKIIAWEGCS